MAKSKQNSSAFEATRISLMQCPRNAPVIPLMHSYNVTVVII